MLAGHGLMKASQLVIPSLAKPLSKAAVISHCGFLFLGAVHLARWLFSSLVCPWSSTDGEGTPSAVRGLPFERTRRSRAGLSREAGLRLSLGLGYINLSFGMKLVLAAVVAAIEA
jgi:hypothetical protein